MAVAAQATIQQEVRYDPARKVADHVSDLRRALVISALCLITASTVAFAFVNKIAAFFQAPLNQPLYYTTPGGGLTFTLKICLTVGAIICIPILLNRTFSFVKPAVNPSLHRSFAWYTVCSALLALAGVTFAYYLSLPSALAFLTSIHVGDLKALINADSYYTFLMAYLLGYALLFQTPVVMLAINKIKPFGPRGALKYERHVIGFSFVVAALLTPTPDPWNQLLMALPIIILYQLGIVALWLSARRSARRTRKNLKKHNLPATLAPTDHPKQTQQIRVPKRVVVHDIRPVVKHPTHNK